MKNTVKVRNSLLLATSALFMLIGLSPSVRADIAYFLRLTGGTLTGNLVMDTAGGVNAVISETGISRTSGSTQTWNIRNLDGGMTLQVNGTAVQAGAIPLASGVSGVLPVANGFAGTYIETVDGGGTRIMADPSYFNWNNAASSVTTRYVNPTNGNDYVCDGKSSASAASADGGVGSLAACAWKTVQRALDDVPDGFVGSVVIQVAAGTFGGTQLWILYAQPGALQNSVNIQGDCSSPQAAFTTTGAGSFVSTNGVTSVAQVNSTPTVSNPDAGYIPSPISDGQFWIVQTNTTTGLYTVHAVMGSDAGVTQVSRSTGALSSNSPKLCPWATEFTGSVKISSSHRPQQNSYNLKVSGIKFDNVSTMDNISLNGVSIVQSSSPTFRNVFITGGNYIDSGGLVWSGWNEWDGITDSAVLTSQSNANALQVLGKHGAVVGLLVGTRSAATGGVGIGVGIENVSVGTQPEMGGSLGLRSVEIQGKFSVGIRMEHGLLFGGNNGNLTTPLNSSGLITCSGTMMAMNLTGTASSPLVMEYGSHFVGCGAITGKSTAPSKIRSGSHAYFISADGITNTNDGGLFVVGGNTGVSNLADLPVTDVGATSPEFVRVSNAAE